MDDQPIEVRSLTDEDFKLAKEVGLDLRPYAGESTLTRKGFREITDDDKSVSLGDYGRAIGVGAVGIATGAAALTEYATSGKVGGDARRSLEKTSEEISEGMGPRAQRAMSAEFFPDAGKQSILDDFGASLGLKSVASLPSVVASIIPAGLAVRALGVGGAAARLGIAEGAAGAAERGAIAAGVSRGTNSVLTGGEVAQQLYSAVDKMSDEELQTNAPIYAGYRSMMSEKDARRLYMKDVAGAAPVIGMLVGAATPGVETMIAQRLGGEAAKGFGKGLATGALTEAGQELVESSTGEFLTQDALVKAGLKGEMDWGKVIAQGLEGALIGAGMGGVGGGVTNIGKGATPNGGLVDPAQAVALGGQQQELPPPPVATAEQPPVSPTGPASVQTIEPSDMPAEIKAALDRANGVTPREAEAAPAPIMDQLGQEPAPQALGETVANRVADDAGQTVAENEDILKEQQKKLIAGEVPAQMFTPGETELPLPEGMVRVQTPKGVFHFNPKAKLRGRPLNANTVRGLAFQGRENLILGLGDKNKAQVAAEAQAKSEPIVAAVERTREGTEVKAAATTPSDAPRIVDQLQENASPGNTTQVEPVQQVLEQRAEPETPSPAPVPAPEPPTPPVTAKSKPAPGRVLTDKAAAALDVQAAKISRGARGQDSNVAPDFKDRNARVRFITRAQNAVDDLGDQAPAHYATAVEKDKAAKALGKKPSPKERKPLTDAINAAWQAEYELEQAGTPRYAIGKGKTGAVQGQVAKAEAKVAKKNKAIVDAATAPEDEAPAYKPRTKTEKITDDQIDEAKKENPALKGINDPDRARELLALIRDQELDSKGKLTQQGGAFSSLSRPEALVEGDEGLAEMPRSAMVPVYRSSSDGEAAPSVSVRFADEANPADELNTRAELQFKGGDTKIVTRAAAAGDARSVSADLIAQYNANAAAIFESLNKNRAEVRNKMTDRRMAINEEMDGKFFDNKEELFKTLKQILAQTNSLDELIDLSFRLNEMTDAEFKEWLVSTVTTKPELWVKANLAAEVFPIEHLEVANLRRVAREIHAEPVKAERTMTLKQAMEEVRKKAGPSKAPLAEAMHRFLFNRIINLIGDMQVRIVNDGAMDRATMSGTAQGVYRGDTNDILLRSSEINGSHASYQLILHEALHGALATLIETNPAFKRRVDTLRKHVLSKVSEKQAEEYGLKDPHEFISEAMTNPKFQELLSKVSLTRQEMAGLGLQDSSILTKFSDAFNALIGLVAKTFGLPPQSRTVLEQAIRLTDEGLQMREEKGLGAEFSKADEAQIKQWDEAVDNLRPSDFLAKLANPKERFTNELVARGVDKSKADLLAKNLVDAMGDKATLSRALPLIKQLAKQFGTPKAAGAKGKQAVQKAKARAASPAPRPAPVKPVPPTYTPAQQIANAAKDKGGVWKNRLSRVAVVGSTLDQLRQIYKGMFQDDKGDALAQLVEGIQRMAPYSTAKRETADKLAQKFIDYAKADPQKADNLANLAVDATMANVQLGPNANNKHLGKKWRSWQSLARLPELQNRYATQLDDAGRALYQEMTEFYRNTQNDLTRGLIDNILREVQIAPTGRDAFIQRVMDNQMTKADEALFASQPKVLEALKDATELRAIQGDYFPLMRHGDFVVTTNEKVKDTGGGKEIEPGKVEFRAATQREAMRLARDYAESTDMDVLSIKKSADTATSTDFGVTVELQTKGVHFFDDEESAFKWRRENEKNFDEVSQVQPVRDGVKGAGDLTTSQFNSLIATINSQPNVNDKTKDLMKGVMQQAAARMMSGNRVQKRSIARRNVRGASTDFGRNLVTYGQATAGYLSKIRYMPEVREALKRMSTIANDSMAADAPARVRVLNEIKARIDQNVVDMKELPRPVRNLLTLTFLGKLFSPMYNVINGMQPTMTTYPILAGEYGTIDAGKALGDAYATLGFTDAVWGGIRNTYLAGKQITNTGLLDTSDIVGSIIKKVTGEEDGKRLAALFTELQERGAMASGGFELSQTLVEGSATNRALAKFERIARQMPQAIENVNRAVTGIAAYRLSFAKAKADAKKDGKTDAEADLIADAKARGFAFDTVMNTQGDYSAANAPRFFNKGYLSLALMFKKYVQMMSYLLVDMAHKSFKGATHEERMAARKAFVQLFAVQIAFAGALSLPGLEIAKAAFMLAAFFGAGDGWDEQEEKLRKLADEKMGKYGGELFMKGVISRALDLDISQRVSLSDMFLFGEPKKYDKEGVNAYLAQLVFGAPGSVAQGLLDAAKDAGNGDWMKAAYKGIPVKFIADIIKAKDQYDEGKITRREQVMNALGARSGRQAEEGREIGNKVRAKQAMEARRDQLRKEYLNPKATPGQLAVTKAKIAAFNKEAPFNLRIGGLDKVREIQRAKKIERQGAD